MAHEADRIVRVHATAIEVPYVTDYVGESHRGRQSACVCEVETEDGLIGHGFTGITDARAVAAIIELVAGPAVIGSDALRHEQLWEHLYWTLAPRGQTGYAAHAIAAIDVALWDLKGKRLGEPVWRLLGGARDRVRTYTTFGFDHYSVDQLADAARYWKSQGHTRLKMTVASGALRRRDRRPVDEVIAEDSRRVHAVREALGPEGEIYLDANCSMSPNDALRLGQLVADADISFFEEPITQNDVRQLAGLRRALPMPLAAGQNEGLAFRFRDLLLHEAVDVLQPNVVIGGGFTQCLRIAGLASAFNVEIDNGGGWPFHNMHLHAGVANGGMAEYHVPAVLLCEQIYDELPKPDAGWLDLPVAPGLGFNLLADAVSEFAVS